MLVSKKRTLIKISITFVLFNHPSAHGDITLCSSPTTNPLGYYTFCEPQGVYNWPINNYPPCSKTTCSTHEFVVSRDYLQDFDPLTTNQIAVDGTGSRIFASPGEEEPASFILIASPTTDMENVVLQPTYLKSGKNMITASHITVRRVVRTPLRKVSESKTAPAGNDAFDIVGRFLPKWNRINIKAGEFREVWVSVKVPPFTRPGIYRGFINIRFGGNRLRKWRFAVEVLPIHLVENPGKSLGIFYNLGARIKTLKFDKENADPAIVQADLNTIKAEIKDLGNHGIRTIQSGIQLFEKVVDSDGTVTFIEDLNTLRTGLEFLQKAQIPWKTIIVKSGLDNLADQMGYDPKTGFKKTDGTLLNGTGLNGTLYNATDWAIYKERAKHKIQELQSIIRNNYPEFNVVLSNLDEIFEAHHPEKPPLYEIMATACREVPEMKLAVTLSTQSRPQDPADLPAGTVEENLRKEYDPLIDLRMHHGVSFEWWLARSGNSIRSYLDELHRSGDEAWFYHNRRGTYHTAKWDRIIDGVFLWSSPFSVHIPWTYQRYFRNPFDDTESDPSGTTSSAAASDVGFSFPAANRSIELVPTRAWEARREGFDDLRYFYTLQSMANAKKRAGTLHADTEILVDSFFKLLNRLSTGIELSGYIAKNSCTANESPIISALAQYRGKYFTDLRHQAANLIVRIQNEK